MKQQLKQILGHNWFFPIILLNYGLFYILFLEKYPASDGFGTDGYVYRSLIIDFTKSNFYDAYYIHRIFPSLLIRNIFSLASLELSPVNIFYGFEFLNLACLVVSAFYIKKLLVFFKITFKNQLLAFLLLFINFAALKWPYYFPAMTDSIAFMLSIVLLYAYLENSTVWIAIITIVLAFTWPMGFYQGLLLIAFPYRPVSYGSPGKMCKAILYIVSLGLFLSAFIYVILVNKGNTDLVFVPRIEQNLLLYSVLFVAMMYLAFARLFFNTEIFNLNYLLKSLDLKRIFLALSVFAGVAICVSILDLPQSKIYNVSSVLENPVIHSLVRPLLSIVAHFSFYGIAVCLIIIFWKDLSATISKAGHGLLAAIALNLYLFGIMPESRMLINLFPWLIILLIYSVNNYSFTNAFYIVTAGLCAVASKIWLLIDYEMDYVLGMVTDKNGSLDFPNQRFYMNLGPWMSEKAYYIHGGAMLISVLILFFMVYRIRVQEGSKVKLNGGQ